MKKALQLLALSILIFSFAACKKCVECTTKSEVMSGGVLISASVSEEKCGKKSELDDFEAEKSSTDAYLKVDDNNWTRVETTCVKK